MVERQAQSGVLEVVALEILFVLIECWCRNIESDMMGSDPKIHQPVFVFVVRHAVADALIGIRRDAPNNLAELLQHRPHLFRRLGDIFGDCFCGGLGAHLIVYYQEF